MRDRGHSPIGTAHRAWATFVVMLTLVVSGLLTDTRVVSAAEHGATLTVDCSRPGLVKVFDGVCIWRLDPDDGANREAHLAAHPTDPDTVLVTWRSGEWSEGPRIWAGMTTDGGATWRVTKLRNPNLLDVPGMQRYAYDSTAAFGPDGTAYVLYGGENRGVGIYVEDRVTLAKSVDDGETWTFHTFRDMPNGVLGPDYPDFSVAPDSGDIYVVSQDFSGVGVSQSAGLWLWKSTDGGQFWTPKPLLVNDPSGIGAIPYGYIPRVVAGPKGFVMVTFNLFDLNTFAGAILVSRDGGNTFEGPTIVHPYDTQQAPESTTFINDPGAVWSQRKSTHVALVYGDGDRVIGLRSRDSGTSWSKPTVLTRLPAQTGTIWLSAAADDKGTVYAEYRYGSDNPPVFGVGLLRWSADGQVQTLRLVHAKGVAGEWIVGDDYGALDVAADGSPWAAFSDLRDHPRERIAVTHAVTRRSNSRGRVDPR